MSPEYRIPAGMGRREFHAMGTTISLLVPEKAAEQSSRLVQELFIRWEQTLSRFLPASELSRLNARPRTPVAVGYLLYHVLTTALEAAEATAGIYDPALLDQLVQLGYDRTFERLPDAALTPFMSGKPGGGWHGIQIDPVYQCVTLPTGVRLDFGGIAKGMAVDAALEKLRTHGIERALVNAGGDLAVFGQLIDANAWYITVPGRKMQWMIPVQHGAVATSGIAHRHWSQNKQFRHHLLDPRTGLPVENNLWSATVVADRCEQAEVAAKVAFILGSEEGADFLRQHQIAGLLVQKDGSWQACGPWDVHLMEEL